MAESKLTHIASDSVATGALMPLVSLKKHYKISIIVFGVMAVLAFPIAWLKGKAYYSATAVVYIAPRTASILQETKEQEIPSYQQFITQQASSATRYDNVLLALQKLGEKRFVWQLPEESDRRAAERLQAALVSRPIADTYLFSISLESDRAEGLDEIVNTLVDIYYQQAHSEQQIYASKERLDILYKRREEFQTEINEKKHRLAEISQELSVTTFADNVANPFDQMLADSKLAYSVAQRERMAAEANLGVYENPKDPRAATALDSMVSDIVYKDEGMNSLKYNLYQRSSQLVEQISGLDKRHPGFGQIRAQLDNINKELNDTITKLSNDVRRMLLDERRAKVTLTRDIEQGLQAKIKEQEKSAAWF